MSGQVEGFWIGRSDLTHAHTYSTDGMCDPAHTTVVGVAPSNVVTSSSYSRVGAVGRDGTRSVRDGGNEHPLRLRIVLPFRSVWSGSSIRSAHGRVLFVIGPRLVANLSPGGWRFSEFLDVCLNKAVSSTAYCSSLKDLTAK